MLDASGCFLSMFERMFRERVGACRLFYSVVDFKKKETHWAKEKVRLSVKKNRFGCTSVRLAECRGFKALSPTRLFRAELIPTKLHDGDVHRCHQTTKKSRASGQSSLNRCCDAVKTTSEREQNT